MDYSCIKAPRNSNLHSAFSLAYIDLWSQRRRESFKIRIRDCFRFSQHLKLRCECCDQRACGEAA